MTTIFLVTAGQTNWDTEERIQGNLSVPLNSHGVVQIARLAAERSDVRVSVIYTGQGQDAVQTAGILAKAWGGKIRKNEALSEVDLGFWQGLLRSEAARRFGGIYRKWQRNPLSIVPPHGEALDDAYHRIASETRRITQRHPRDSVGIVCGLFAGALVKCYLKDIDIRGIFGVCSMPGTCEVIEAR